MRKITLFMMILLPLLGMSQTFEFNNTDDGWNVLNGFTAANNATYMTLTTVAGDGSLKNPLFGTTTAGVDTNVNKFVGITLRNNSTEGPTYMRVSYPKPTSGRVYKSVEITAGDTDFVTYWIELKGGKWTGTMNDIKVHFKAAGNSNYVLPTNPVTIDIDKIEFAPHAPTTEQHVYEFDTDNDAEGWVAAGGTIAGPANGVITFTPEADKFAKLKQTKHHVDASQYVGVIIKLKNTSASNSQLKVIMNGDGGNAVETTLTTGDSDFKTYEIDLSGSAAWTGNVVVDLRFGDPNNATTAGKWTGTGDIIIDRIEFVTNLSVANNQLNNFEVTPNPVKDFVKINTENTIKEISIYDLTGKMVMKANNTVSNNIDVRNLNAGIYLIKVLDVNNNVGTQKFVKVN